MRKIIISGILLCNILLSACSQPEEKSHDHSNENQQTAAADIREETSGADVLPQFLEEKPEDMQIIYRAAAQNRNLLEKIPCYCGCGDSVGHKDNYDCFVHENKENGEIIWDDHGTKCIVCLEIAAKAITDLQNGKTVKEIRSEIDQQYEKGYAEPTPTEEV